MLDLIILAALAGPPASPPILDMHLHAESVAEYGPPGQKFCMEFMQYVDPHDAADGAWPDRYMAMSLSPACAEPVSASASDDGLMRETLAVMDRRNIIGVVSGSPETVARWSQASPKRVIRGRGFNLKRDAGVSAEALVREHRDGAFDVLAEVTNQYAGYGPNAPEFEAYWQAAEDNDFPVGIHIGTSPPGAAYMFAGARVALGDPLLLEEVLVRHPKLRIYAMHAGMPFQDNMIAMLQAYPQLYVGTGVLQSAWPRAEFYAYLERLVRAGYAKRIMYGTDQMIWPGLIEPSIEAIEKAPFLTSEQKRDILYNNAARFLRLPDEEIARHHGR